MSNQKLLLITLLLTLFSCAYAQKEEGKSLTFSFHGYAQMGHSAIVAPQRPAHNSFYIGKVELMTQAQFSLWDMGAIVQFNSPVTLKELYMGYKFMPELKLRIGQIKTPFGLENQLVPCLNNLASGGSNPTLFFAGIAGDPRYFGTGGRDIGIELSGKLFGEKLGYYATIMNGNGINRLSSINPKMYGLALDVKPVKGMLLKASYVGGKMVAMDNKLPYLRQRLSFGGQWKSKIVDIMAEYMYGRNDYTLKSEPTRNNPSAEEYAKQVTEHAHGAYITTAFHLPKRFDIVVAADYLNRNTAQKNSICSATIGVQHWFWGICRWQVEYQYRHLTGEIPFLSIHAPGHKIATQVQFAF